MPETTKKYRVTCLNGYDEKYHDGYVVEGPSGSDIRALSDQFLKTYGVPRLPYCPDADTINVYTDAMETAKNRMRDDGLSGKKAVRIGECFCNWLVKYHGFSYMNIEHFTLVLRC